MLLILTSPDVVAPGGTPNDELVKVLIKLARDGNRVAAVSNHNEPSWFARKFGGTPVEFKREYGRQNGTIVTEQAQRYALQPCETMVLSGPAEDLQMGKNGHAVIVSADWAANDQGRKYGIRVADAEEFKNVVELTAEWPGKWWFEGHKKLYSVRALSDLSGYNKETAQQVFARDLVATVKRGDHRLTALLVVIVKSLLMSGYDLKEKLVWGVYPSSGSSNDDNETLSEFTHRVRTAVSRVQFAKAGQPLFFRHSPSTKRSGSGFSPSARIDPTEQIATLQLNPWYNRKLIGKNVIVLDDCTTYGVSFGVAAALLRAAGAASVCGIALGKFGDQLRYYDIELNADPFAPVPPGSHRLNASSRMFEGVSTPSAQQWLRKLIG
jgi:hypothetical protein